jgi:P4 family phage/plasmid primase-like protien
MPGTVSFSIITKDSGILTKEFSLTDDDTLKKDSGKCKLATGSVQRLDVDFDQVGDILEGLMLDQAITLGVPKISEGKLVAAEMQGKHPGAITRTKNNFSFARDGFMIYFDYDPQPGQVSLTKDELIAKLRALHPALGSAAMLWRPSSSSYIYDGDKQMSGLTGQHVYVPCRNPEKLEQFITTLKCECWLQELGWIMISAAGTALERGLFDTAVFSPERLVFEAGAQLVSPLTQDLPESEYFPGEMIDLRKAESIDPSFIGPVKDLIAKKKFDLAEEIAQVREQYIQRQTDALVKSTGIPAGKARKVIDGRFEGLLLSQDLLQTDDETFVSVKDILNNPEQYSGMTFRDPLEPDYGKSKAKIFVNDDGSIICNSFAHGGRTFKLKHDDLTFDYWLDNATPAEIEERWVWMVASASDTAVAEAKLLEKLKSKLGVGVNVLRRDLNTFRKTEQKETPQKLNVDDNGVLAGLIVPTDEDDLTHNQIAELYIKQMPKNVVGAEGTVYQYNGKCIWEGLDLNTIQQKMLTRFDGFPKCSRKADYRAISTHIYDKIKDDSFFLKHQPCFATPSTCYVVNGRDIDETTHEAKYKIRHMFPYDADPDLPIPMFLGFLQWLFEQDPVQIDLLQEIFGAMLFGLMNYQFHKAALFKGPGNNGKGVVFNIIREIVPEPYICVVSPFDMRRGDYRAQLAGKLINLVPELPANGKIPGEIFKQVVDSSRVSARRLYEAPFEFTPICSQVFSSNYFIDSDDASEGMFRRWLLLGFDSVISEKNRINDYGKVIADAEGPGILYWALLGAERLLEQNHFTHTKTHDHMMEQWKMRIDPVIGFVRDEDWVAYVPNTILNRHEAYAAYDAWCVATHYSNVGKAQFDEGMKKRFGMVQHKGDWSYEGVQLLRGGGGD